MVDEELSVPRSERDEYDAISSQNTESGSENRSSSRSKSNGTWPADCYSFIALHGPTEDPVFFGFGFMVWAFQIAFLILLVLRVASPKLSTNEDTDNPDDGFWAQFIPSNVGGLSRVTQFMALTSYCIFADESLKDIVTAVETWPKFVKAKPGDKVRLIMLSCSLRFAQGMLATISVVLLVITTSDVIDIILNFTAVNFISAFDDVAFELAQWGKYGPRLEAEANRIEELPVPDCIFRKYQHVRYRFTVIPIAFILFVLFILMAIGQDSRAVWLTQTLRVQFKDDSALEPYSGCYNVSDISRKKNFKRKRVVYDGFEVNPGTAKFGYCEGTRKWYMHVSNETDACDIRREDQLAHSQITYAYDISSSFEGTWYSPSGTPLELFFFENEDGLDDVMCGSFLGDGICNRDFNTAEYEYDQGDCCAATCKYASCGLGTMSTIFGTDDTIGDGFPECENPGMKPITILVDDVYLPSNISVFTLEQESFMGLLLDDDVPPRNPTLIVDCDGRNLLMTTISPRMEKKTETIMVSDGAECTMMVRNSTISMARVWNVNYTIFHGYEESISSNPLVIARGSSFERESITFQRIPDCFLKELNGIIDISTIYTSEEPSNKAIKWLMNDPSGFSRCGERFFLERYALATINFAAPIVFGTSSTFNESSKNEDDDRSLWITPDRHCVWSAVGCIDGSVVELAIADHGLKLKGTIATEIGLLSNLRVFDMNDQLLTGSIPSEFGLLKNLTVVVINENLLEGTIPTEIGQLSKLLFLDLNSNTRISGTIPKEIGNLSSLQIFHLFLNVISGSIPSEIIELSSLMGFLVGGNRLTGTIPSAFKEMEKLEYLRLDYNFLSGTIPSELGLLSAESILMDYNLLTGFIPQELLDNDSLMDLGVYGNALSDLIPLDGSVICVAPEEQQFEYGYGTAGGEHYCDCQIHDCMPSSREIPPLPNRCACEEARACCDTLLKNYTRCVVCPNGLANPDYYVAEQEATCGELDNYVYLNVEQFGTKELCDAAIMYGGELGCRCNVDALAEMEEDLIGT
jgi:hypothetical protein